MTSSSSHPFPHPFPHHHPSFLRVPPGLRALSEAVGRAQTEKISVILLEAGLYDEEGNCVDINISISIVGAGRETIVRGGLQMNGKKEDDVNVSNLTLKGDGVVGNNGASIHLDNVSVEESQSHGVAVYGTKRNSMKNCNVSHSKLSGLFVNGDGLMTIEGNSTTIHLNCQHGDPNDYGLHTGSSSDSSIHLESPLTIETISTDNGGGGDYGGAGTIKTVDNKGAIIQTLFFSQKQPTEESKDDKDDRKEGKKEYTPQMLRF